MGADVPTFRPKGSEEGVSGNGREDAVATGENHWTGAMAWSTATELFLDRDDAGE